MRTVIVFHRNAASFDDHFSLKYLIGWRCERALSVTSLMPIFHSSEHCAKNLIRHVCENCLISRCPLIIDRWVLCETLIKHRGIVDMLQRASAAVKLWTRVMMLTGTSINICRIASMSSWWLCFDNFMERYKLWAVVGGSRWKWNWKWLQAITF